jgi:hypothetical protein
MAGSRRAETSDTIMNKHVHGFTPPGGVAAPREEISGTLEAWRSAGRVLVAAHWDELQELVREGERLTAKGDFASAAAQLQIAANHAVMWHPGMFACSPLEDAIRSLGRAALPSRRRDRPARVDPTGMEVLHIASRVASIGGGSRMIRRWIGRDGANRHSLLVTRQIDPVPDEIRAAVQGSGGRVLRPNLAPGGILSWARRVQTAIAGADLVVFHVDNFDIVPFLALAAMDDAPPITLVNHSDHVLWVGQSFVDIVISSRHSGYDGCIERRGFDVEQCALLPLCLEPIGRTTTRDEARRRLGLPADVVVLASVARSVKYRSLDGVNFARNIAPVLRDNPNVHLLVVGPGGSVDWSDEDLGIRGRLHLYPETSATDVFLDAADIYVDSFPFPSITSMLEAGLHELPLVTLYPFGPGCEVMGADTPGIEEHLTRVTTVRDLRLALGRLVRDADRRTSLGAATRQAIIEANMGERWRKALDVFYRQALAVPRPMRVPERIETPRFDDLDLYCPFVFAHLQHGTTRDERLASAIEAALRVLPPAARVATWRRIERGGGFAFRRDGSTWRYLIPEWVVAGVKSLKAGGRA